MPRVVTGYIPSSVYLRSSYRTKQYPTLTNDQGIKHHHMIVPTPDMVLGKGAPSLLMPSSSGSAATSSTLPTSSPYRNKYELNLQCDSPVGLYNIPQQRTSQAFSSLDDIDAMVVQQQLNSSPVTRLEAAAGNYPSLERSARKKFRNEQQQHHHPQRELPALPKTNLPPPPPRPNPDERNRSMEDLHKLEATHGRQKMQYREITDNNSNTWSGGGPYPLPPSVNRTTLLPGQTYPEPQPANGPLNLGMVASIQDVLFNTKLSGDNNNKKDFSNNVGAVSNNGADPPPLYPKQYHQVVEQRRRSLLNNHNESPAVNRKVKPLLATPPLSATSAALTSPLLSTSIATASPPLPPSNLDSSFDNSNSTTATTTPTLMNGDSGGLKYVPYRETTKPFEMSDFYKYSTKYRKSASSLKSGESESSDRSSTTSSGGSSQPPPEVPARSAAPPPPPLISSAAVISSPHAPPIPSTSSPAKLLPPPPPPKNSLNTHTSNTSLADAFSSEMLAWYNTQNTPVKSAASNSTKTSSSSSSSAAATKPATLV